MNESTHPSHYTKHCVTKYLKWEPIDFCERLGFNLGNAVKYLVRYLDKGNPALDLEKAKVYLQRELDNDFEYSADALNNAIYNEVTAMMIVEFKKSNYLLNILFNEDDNSLEKSFQKTIDAINEAIRSYSCDIQA